MKSHNQAIEKSLTNIKSYFKLAAKFHIKLGILMVISLFLGCTIAFSVSNANQHDDSQKQFNVEAFDRQMILEADEVSIEYTNYNITATGNVRIHYDIYTLTAGKVHFNRRDSIFTAEEDVKLLEPSRNIIVADNLEFTGDRSRLEGIAEN